MEGMNITIKKNDIITLEITDITAEGKRCAGNADLPCLPGQRAILYRAG